MTAQNIIDTAKLDFPDETDTRALSDLQAIHDDLCWEFKIKVADVSLSSLVAGTAGYTLPSNTSRVFSARYVRSSTDGDWKTLEHRHIDELDQIRGEWRKEADGEPKEFYIEGGKLYLHPAPDTSTSGGYPKVDMQVSQYETLAVGTTFPEFPNYNAWVYGTRMKMALRTGDQRYAEYARLYDIEKARLSGQTTYRAAYHAPRLISSYARTGGRRKA